MSKRTTIDLVDYQIPPPRPGDPPVTTFTGRTRRGAVYQDVSAIVVEKAPILKGTPFSKPTQETTIRLAFFADPDAEVVERAFLLMSPGVALECETPTEHLEPLGIAFVSARTPLAVFEIHPKDSAS